MAVLRLEVVRVKLQQLMSRRQNPEAPTKSLTVKRDAANFVAQWGNKYGGGFNIPKIRNWNIDIFFEAMRWLPVEYQRMIINENTFYVNDPVVSANLEYAMRQRQGPEFSEMYFSMFD